MHMETIKKLQALLDESVDKGEIAGACFCAAEKGKKVCCLESGYADLENKTAMRRDHIFRLYSMSKPVTAAAAMALMERGRLDLAEPVSAYLPAFRSQRVRRSGGREEPAHREIMIKDLLNMTSGLMYPDFPGEAGRETNGIFRELQERLLTKEPMGTQELAEKLGKAPLAFSPGESWLYGSSADVLGAVLEKAAGIPFSEVLRQYIFDPLEMSDTGFYVPEEKQGRLTKVYEASADGLKLYTEDHLGIINAMDRKPAFESGGAGLVSTADDFMKFAEMLLNEGTYREKTVLRPGTVRFLTGGALLDNQQRAWEQDFFTLGGYSYGNLMRVRKNNACAWYPGEIGEYGWDGWLGCYFSNDPHNGRSIVFMTQLKDAGTLPVLRKMRNVIYAGEAPFYSYSAIS